MHFTQVIWKGSTEFGIGYAKSDGKDGMKCHYAVARYRPGGNMAGEYAENVPKGDFKKEDMCNGDEVKEEIFSDQKDDNQRAGNQPANLTETGQPLTGKETPQTSSKLKNQPETSENTGTNQPADQTDNNEGPGKESPEKQKTNQTTPGEAVDETSESGFAKAGLEAHNILRRIHKVPELKLNDEMTKSATAYAKELAKLGTLKHSERGERDNNGENLAFACSSGEMQYPASDPVGAWYSEVCEYNYKFGASEPTSGTLHFTQLIWKESTELGIGYAKGEKDGMTCYYAVGRYKIAGNMGGKYVENVPEGDFKKENVCDGTKLKPEILEDTGKTDNTGTNELKEQNGGNGDNESSNNTGTVQTADQNGDNEGPGKETPEKQKANPNNAGESVDETSESGFAKAGLEAHNILRRIHKVPELKLNDEMTKSATAYAEKLAKLGTLKHAERGERDNNGENLAFACSSGEMQYPASDPVGAWYSEVCEYNYKFGASEPTSGTLHFTQLIWKESTELGIGYAKGEKDGMTCYYAVGRYKIAGNMGGKYVENVPEGDFKKENVCDGTKLKPEILEGHAREYDEDEDEDDYEDLHRRRKVEIKVINGPKRTLNGKSKNSGILKKGLIPKRGSSMKNKKKKHEVVRNIKKKSRS